MESKTKQKREVMGIIEIEIVVNQSGLGSYGVVNMRWGTLFEGSGSL